MAKKNTWKEIKTIADLMNNLSYSVPHDLDGSPAKFVLYRNFLCWCNPWMLIVEINGKEFRFASESLEELLESIKKIKLNV